ncbi:MAG TPA: DsbA family oxidoreductase [Alphaproteobacteria bacterium]|nr:DsbA family oxidoreductase [Alphaproteobacteria bacterium]
MIIDIVSDTICPWCFVGKRRLERALTLAPQSDLQITWHPFQLNPDMPAEGMDRREYLRLKFGDSRGSGAYDAIREAGAGEGIEFNFDGIVRTPNTVDSHRVIRFALDYGLQDAVVESLFNAYFVDGHDISDRRELLDAGARAGLERGQLADYLEGDEGSADVANADQMARRMGIQGVPCFILDRKYVISGAQSPDLFVQAFGLIGRDAASVDEETREN